MGALGELIRWNGWPPTNTPAGVARAVAYGILGNLLAPAIFALLGIDAPNTLGGLLWPAIGGSAAIHVLFAWLVLRGSRAAAIASIALLFADYGIAVVGDLLPSIKEDPETALVPFVLLLLLVNGARGAFALHRRAADPSGTRVA